MYRPLAWLLALVLAPTVLLAGGPSASGAQGQERTETAFQDVFFEIPATGRQELDGGRILQPYLFTFALPSSGSPEQGASIPEQQGQKRFIESRYSLVVQVLRGDFVLAVQPGDVAVVDPKGAPIPVLMESDRTYDPVVPEEFVQDSAGNDCTSICAVPADTAVRIEEGATVYLPRGVACLVCSFDTENAQLQVFVILEPTDGTPTAAPEQFEWITGEGIVTAEAAGTPAARRWANPSTRCQ